MKIKESLDVDFVVEMKIPLLGLRIQKLYAIVPKVTTNEH